MPHVNTSLSAYKDFFLARKWRGRPYLISPFFDLSFVGGLALLAFAMLVFIAPSDPHALHRQQLYIIALMGFLTFFMNDPHFIMSYQLLYRDYPAKLKRFRSNRELWARYIIAGMVVPAAMAAYFLYAFIAQRADLFSYAITAMLISVGWHYAKQAYGVFIVLSLMKKVYYSRWQRILLLCNSYVFWLVYSICILSDNTGRQSVGANPWGFDYPSGHHFELAEPFQTIIAGLFIIFAFISLVVATYGKIRPSYSRTALLGYFSMYYLLLLSVLDPIWIVIYPFFHSLQYGMFVYAYKRGEAGARMVQAVDEQQKRIIRNQYLRFIAVAFLAGILFFAALPGSLEGWINPRHAILFPMTAAMVVFINIHHFFIDNVIWRKEHSEIAQYLFSRP